MLSQTALYRYHMRDFDAAEVFFQDLRTRDPYRLEGLDTFSNILFVKEETGTLSYVAHEAVKIGKVLFDIDILKVSFLFSIVLKLLLLLVIITGIEAIMKGLFYNIKERSD